MVDKDPTLEFGSIKVGVRQLEDAILDLGFLKRADRSLADKNEILRALANNDVTMLRRISDYFYKTSGIYQKICNYFASMYRYDWYVVPEIYDESVKEKKVIAEFKELLAVLDNSYIKQLCDTIALKVIKDGCYYGYLVPSSERLAIQELPVRYCRSRYFVGANPAVEFNMKFFDDTFSDINYRMRVIKMFPPEFAKGYMLYKQGKLKADFYGDNYSGSWYLLDPNSTVKFNLNQSDTPMFVNATPAIIDLDNAQDLDRKKQMQKLLKILVQKLPIDKNGDLIFDVDEAKDIHENAVQMLKRAVGVDILTTFADIQAVNIQDSNTTTSVDDLEKVERAVFNSVGSSRNLFNTDGNLSLEKSILTDEASIRELILQFNAFFDRVTQAKSSNKKKYNFRLYMLETTQNNYQALSKMYKDQVQLGYSKMLPQIALGHSQSSILNTAHFENNILHLSEVMIPPLMSSTLNAEELQNLGNKGKTSNNKTEISTEGETGEAGRPEKPDSEKSEKTLQNIESMS